MKIAHLQLVSKRNKLSLKENDCQPISEGYMQLEAVLDRPLRRISVEYENVVAFYSEPCSSCLSTLMLFLRRFKDDMSLYLFEDG